MTAVCSISLATPSTITLVTSLNHLDHPLSDSSSSRPLGPNLWSSQATTGNPLSEVLEWVGLLEAEGWTTITSNQTSSDPKAYNFILSRAAGAGGGQGRSYTNGVSKQTAPAEVSVASPHTTTRRRSTLKLGDPNLPSAAQITQLRLSSVAPKVDVESEKVEWAEGTVVVGGGSSPAGRKTPPKELPDHVKNGTFTDSESDADTPKNKQARQGRTASSVARAEKRESAFFAQVQGNQDEKKKAEAAKLASMSVEQREKYESEMVQKAKHDDLKKGHMQRLGMTYNKRLSAKRLSSPGGRGREGKRVQ